MQNPLTEKPWPGRNGKVVAAMMVHASNGFFMNWMGNEKGEGFEYHLLALGLSLVAIVGGGGKGSVDSLLARSPAEQSHPDSSKESRVNRAHATLAMERAL